MKIIYISNFMNHHQSELSENLYKILGENYKFIALESLPKERKEMGYLEMNDIYPFVIKAYENEKLYKKALKLTEECDVLLVGSAPDSIVLNRLKDGKLTIKCSERYFKKSNSKLYFFRNLYTSLRHIKIFQNYPLYYLCSSAYTAADVNMFADFENKCYKWGYFPKVEKYNIEELLKNKFSEKNNSCASILWVGRLIGWKHPDASILLAEKLKNEGYNFKLSIIGTGELEENLKTMIIEKKLSDCVNILGAMSPEEVREYMKEADIYLFTSDRNEGWGAVLNESMNSGCAVVASHAIGSVPFLIENEKNGLIYKDGDYEDFYKKVTLLLDSKERRQELSKNAYFTMTEIWNAENAAKRFISLAQAILDGEKNLDIFETGVCSKAKEIKDDWYE